MANEELLDRHLHVVTVAAPTRPARANMIVQSEATVAKTNADTRLALVEHLCGSAVVIAKAP